MTIKPSQQRATGPLIALLLAGVAGCDPTPEEQVSEFDAARQAAEQGHADAQYILGDMHYNGDGVPQDDVEAYAWCSVAAPNGDEYAIKLLPQAKAHLTSDQLIAAEKRAAEKRAAEKRAAELTEQINANKVK
jgi:TPR repeat protein